MERLGRTTDSFVDLGADAQGRSRAQVHLADGATVRDVISLANDAVELAAFNESMASMNDIFIRAVNESNHGASTFIPNA